MATTLGHPASSAQPGPPRAAIHEPPSIPRPHLDAIVARAVTLGPARVAVAYPCNASAIEAVVTAQRKGLAEPILVGPRKRIEARSPAGSRATRSKYGSKPATPTAIATSPAS